MSEIPTKWQYIHDRLIIEGDPIGAELASEIDAIIQSCDYPQHTKEWIKAYKTNDIKRIDTGDIISSVDFCTACDSEKRCDVCKFAEKGGKSKYDILDNHYFKSA